MDLRPVESRFVRPDCKVFTGSLLVILAWGALSFGAVYPWAYGPLILALTSFGVWGLFTQTEIRRQSNRVLPYGMLLLAGGVLTQLVPLPRSALLAVSPAADSFLIQNDLSYALRIDSGASVVHSLSIEPNRTRLGLLMLTSLGVFVLGLTKILDGFKLRALMPRFVILGFIIAMIGIIQAPFFSGKIYGFWTPNAGPIAFSPAGGPFGPFVNRNHFAGWMLMALPLVIGYFGAMAARSSGLAGGSWRKRLEWFATNEANQAVLVGFAILVMGLSLVMTLSRSGIGCLIVALAILGAVVVRHTLKRSAMLTLVGFLGFVAILSLTWVGMDAVIDRFQHINGNLEGRLNIWQDTLRIFQAFPWTGTGLNTFGIASLSYQTIDRETYHFAEAHNDYLQALAEGGLLLMIPGVILITLFIREARHRFLEARDDRTGYWIRVGAVTGLVAIALQEVVDFSLQIPGNAALFGLLCGIALRPATGLAGNPGERPPARE